MPAVNLINANAGTHPSGTGSYTYWSNFRVLLENVAFDKVAGVWGHDPVSGTWSFYGCKFQESIPGNREIWSGQSGTPLDRFAIEYQVDGNLYWDNNGGFDYALDVSAAQSTDGVGSVALGAAVQCVGFDVDPGGHLKVEVVVANIAFTKQVAIVYTTDGWATFHNVSGTFNRSWRPPTGPHQLNAEDWTVNAFVGTGATGQFAVFYQVDGKTYWDNNYGRNYSF